MMKEFEKSGLQRLIDDKIIVAEADKRGILMREGVVEEQVAKIKKRYATEQEFIEALTKDGMTVSELTKRITDQRKAKFLIEIEVEDKILINPQEVNDFYNANIDKFVKNERVDLDSIYIPFAGHKDKAQLKTQEALAKLKANQDFATVAQEYSQLPSVGIIAKGQLIPKIEETVFALQDGELTEPLETDTGFYIFKLKGRIPAEQSTLEEVKNLVYDQIYQQKYQERFQTWIEQLRKKAYIEIK